ncbi:MAG: nuclease [Bacteroidaceae bacterium]|nr:nuclease [Bacteroidaceae bacterium]
MQNIESLSAELSKSPLMEQAKSYDVLPLEKLNAPIDANPSKSMESVGQNELNNKDVLSASELNKPILNETSEREGLTEKQKEDIKEKTGWSDKIVDSIRSNEEASVYMDAGLKEVNGNLERTDIDWNAKIPQDRIDRMRSIYGDEVADKWAGKTNMDLIREGKAPYGPDGERINLHHIGQKSDSPLAELTDTEHKSNDGVLHDKTKESEIERPVFRKEREAYWQNRYNELNNK